MVNREPYVVAINCHLEGNALYSHSIGNKADISGNDLLRYWETDPDTDVILLYLESFGNPRKFSEKSDVRNRLRCKEWTIDCRCTRYFIIYRFRQAGVIRTDTLEELFDVASLLANQPLPVGNRVGIITNAGGPAILCADACEARGLEVPLLPEDSKAKLRSFLLLVPAIPLT